MNNEKYLIWRCSFMRERLRLGIVIAIIALLSFIILNLSYYSSAYPFWLSTNLTQEVALLFCLGLLLYSPIGRNHPGWIFLLFSWSVTLIPQYWYLQAGIAKLDFVTWSLVFLGQATLLPAQWRLHLISQLGVLACFIAIQFGFNLQLDAQIVQMDSVSFLYLYFFWFCVVCDLSVYLYEKLKYSEFQAKLDLRAEKENSDRLLLNILPESIADRLKKQQSTVDNFSQVTVLFADLVGFTEMSEKMSPPALVELLNDIFSSFDKLVERNGLEKIKTIGDAYMVVAGLPIFNPNHVRQMVDLALEMQHAITQFNEQHHKHLSIRIGIHTGPVVAGVIGINKFAYDLWGDTVNTASRMESHGIADRIQVSEKVYNLLKDKYIFVERGKIQIKGKGEMTTYFLEDIL
jgi:adenylate cyclase